MRQLERALANVDALLRSGGATLDDMMHLVVYLRDPADFPNVEGYLAERLDGLPALIVHGPVCRPDWLIEVEGVAAVPIYAPSLPAF
jgi:enamine deaminase RidA (YjgF/YER057c/UK114 family)